MSRWDIPGESGVYNWINPNGGVPVRFALELVKDAIRERLELREYTGGYGSTELLMAASGGGFSGLNFPSGSILDDITNCLDRYANHNLFSNDPTNITSAVDIKSWYDGAIDSGASTQRERFEWYANQVGVDPSILLNIDKGYLLDGKYLTAYYKLITGFRWQLTRLGESSLSIYLSKDDNAGSFRRYGQSYWFSPRPNNITAFNDAHDDYLNYANTQYTGFVPDFSTYAEAYYIGGSFYRMYSATIDYDLNFRNQHKGKINQIFAFMDCEKEPQYNGGINGPDPDAIPVFDTFGSGITEGLYTPTLDIQNGFVNITSPEIPQTVDYNSLLLTVPGQGEPTIYGYRGADFTNPTLLTNVDTNPMLDFSTGV